MTETDRLVTAPRDGNGPPSLLARANARFVIRCLALDSAADAHVRAELLDRLARELTSIHCRPHAVLCCPGERPDGLSIIQDGVVELVTETAHRNVVTQALYRGDVFGAEEIIGGRPAPWVARAASHVSHLFLPRSAFHFIRRAYPDIAAHLLSGFARRLIRATVRLGTVLTGDVEERTARMLLIEERGGVLPISQSSLAAMTGISRPSLNRALKELCTRRVIEISYRQVRILDRPRLAALAAFGVDQPEPLADGWSAR